MLRGFSAAQLLTTKMYQVLKPAIISNAESLNQQQIAMTLGVLTKEHIKDPDLTSALAHTAVKHREELSEQAISQILRNSAHIDIKLPWLFDQMAPVCRQKIGEFTNQGLANVVWAYATTNTRSDEIDQLYPVIAQEYYNRLTLLEDKRQHKDLSFAFSVGTWSLQKAGYGSLTEHILQNILARHDLIGAASSSDVARFLVVYGNTELEADARILIDTVKTRAENGIMFKQDAVTLMKHWDAIYTKLGAAFPEELDRILGPLCDLVGRQVSELDAKTVTTVIKGIGRRLRSDVSASLENPISCFMSCANQVLMQTNRFDALQLAVIVNTVAKLVGNHSVLSMFESREGGAIDLWRLLSSVGRNLVERDLFHTGPGTEAGGKISSEVQKCSTALSKLANSTYRKVFDGSLEIPVAVSTLTWSFAHGYANVTNVRKLDVDKELLGVLAAHCRILAPLMSPQSLANTAFGIASTGVSSLNLFGAIGTEILNRSQYMQTHDPVQSAQALVESGFSADEISSLAWSFVQQGFTDAPLFELFTAFGSDRLKSSNPMSPRHAVMIAWSSACAGVFNLDFLEQLSKLFNENYDLHQLELAQLFTVDQAVNLLLPKDIPQESIVVLQSEEWSSLSSSSEYSDYFDKSKAAYSYNHIVNSSGETVYTVLPINDDTSEKSRWFRLNLSDSVRGKASQAFLELHQYSESNLQQNVSKLLQEIKAKPPVEEYVTSLHLSLDFAWPQEKVALEINGPSHFIPGIEPPRKSPPTILKERMLEAQGWDVRTLQYYEWSGRTAFTKREWLLSRDDQSRLLRSKLPETLIQQEPEYKDWTNKYTPSVSYDQPDIDGQNTEEVERIAASIYEKFKFGSQVNQTSTEVNPENIQTTSSYRSALVGMSDGEMAHHPKEQATDLSKEGDDKAQEELDRLAYDSTQDDHEEFAISERDIKRFYGRSIDDDLKAMRGEKIDMNSAMAELQEVFSQEDIFSEDPSQENNKKLAFDVESRKTVKADFVIDESGKVVERETPKDNRANAAQPSTDFLGSDLDDLEEAQSGVLSEYSLGEGHMRKSEHNARNADRDMIIANEFLEQYKHARDAESRGDPSKMERLLQTYADKLDISVSSSEGEDHQSNSTSIDRLNQRDRTVLEALKLEYANRNLSKQEEKEARDHLLKQLGNIEKIEQKKGMESTISISEIDKALQEADSSFGDRSGFASAAFDNHDNDSQRFLNSMSTPLLAKLGEEQFETQSVKNTNHPSHSSPSTNKETARPGRKKRRCSFAVKVSEKSGDKDHGTTSPSNQFKLLDSKTETPKHVHEPWRRGVGRRRREYQNQNVVEDESTFETLHQNIRHSQLEDLGGDDPQWQALSTNEKEEHAKQALAEVLGSVSSHLEKHSIDFTKLLRLMDEAYFGGLDTGPSAVSSNDVVSRLRAAVKDTLERKIPSENQSSDSLKFLRAMALRGEAERTAKVLNKSGSIQEEINTPSGGVLVQLLRQTGYGQEQDMKSRIDKVKENFNNANASEKPKGNSFTKMTLSQFDELFGIPSQSQIKSLQGFQSSQDAKNYSGHEESQTVDLSTYSETALSNLIQLRVQNAREKLMGTATNAVEQEDEEQIFHGPDGVKTSKGEMDAFKRLLMGYKISSDGILEEDNEDPEWEYLLQQFTREHGDIPEEDDSIDAEALNAQVANQNFTFSQQATTTVGRESGNKKRRSRDRTGKSIEDVEDQLENIDSSISNMESFMDNANKMEPDRQAHSKDDVWDDLLGDDEVRNMVDRLRSSGTPQSIVSETIQEGLAESQAPRSDFSQDQIQRKAAAKWEAMSDSEDNQQSSSTESRRIARGHGSGKT